MATANFAAQRTIHENRSLEIVSVSANGQPDADAANLSHLTPFCLRASAVLSSRYRDQQPKMQRSHPVRRFFFADFFSDDPSQ
jgi:hypothetical protein